MGGGGSMISGAFSSDTTLPTPVPINKGGTGQTTAQAAIDALTAVSGGSTNEVLTKDGSGNATWQAAGGGGVWEVLGSLTSSTGSLLSEFNFTLSPVVSFPTTYNEVYIFCRGGTDGSTDLRVRLGSSNQSGVLSNVYEYARSTNYQGTFTSGDVSSGGEIILGGHPNFTSQSGFTSYMRIACIEDSSGDDFMMFNGFGNGKDYFRLVGGRVETSGEDDLKYIKFDTGGSTDFTNGSSCVIYGVKYS